MNPDLNNWRNVFIYAHTLTANSVDSIKCISFSIKKPLENIINAFTKFYFRTSPIVSRSAFLTIVLIVLNAPNVLCRICAHHTQLSGVDVCKVASITKVEFMPNNACSACNLWTHSSMAKLLNCHKMSSQKFYAMFVRPTVIPGPRGHRLKATTSIFLRVMMETVFFNDIEESCWTQSIISLKLFMWQIMYPWPYLCGTSVWPDKIAFAKYVGDIDNSRCFMFFLNSITNTRKTQTWWLF